MEAGPSLRFKGSFDYLSQNWSHQKRILNPFLNLKQKKDFIHQIRSECRRISSDKKYSELVNITLDLPMLDCDSFINEVLQK